VDWTLTDIVTKSSNIGAVRLGQALGPKGIESYFRRFGLLEYPGVDFPGEAKGWMPAPDQWSASTIGNVPFGQGVSVTVLQLSRALAAIANGGELVTPHFLLEVPGTDDSLAWPKRRAVSEKTTKLMRQVLGEVVSEGTGSEAAIPGYTVAGKTGTAQKPRTDGRGYATGSYIASFAGFLPAENPQVLIVVTVDEPRGAYYGGAVAAPTFRKIGEFCVSHLKIPPPTAAPAQ
jgi:cell division protein FtsI/penicillin-binding protein 2